MLDGRNRMRACEIAGVEPRFVEWDGVGSPLTFVLSRNLHRRHLNESQWAMIAAQAKAMFDEEAAERKRAGQFGHVPQTTTSGGVDDEKPRENTVTANWQSPARTASADAAELLNVSERSVARASHVLKSADEQVVAAVVSGDVAVSDAAAVANRPKDEQRKALDAKRQGRARTLRQAAEPDGGGNAAGADPSEQDRTWSPERRIRTEAKGFARDFDKLYRRLSALIFACGGGNQHTDQMRECLQRVIDHFHGLVDQFLPRKK